MPPKRQAVTPPATEPDSKRQAHAQAAPRKQLIVPIDQSFRMSVAGCRVYIDKEGVVFDGSLNQTNISNNNNKFYRLQLIETGGPDGRRQYWCTTRWGRVGNDGQNNVIGPDSLGAMMNVFYKKFKEKTGLAWIDRADEPIPHKYVYLERDYDEMSDDDEGDGEDAGVDQVDKPRTTDLKSRLPEQVQSLVRLIFDQTSFDVSLESLGYDSRKLPLGKLGKSAIMKAYGYLKEIEVFLNDQSTTDGSLPDSALELIEELSNLYYSTIPHTSPGIQRLPLIDKLELVMAETDMLGNLQKMEASNDIMEEAKKKRRREKAQTMTLLDQHLAMLKLDEITPLVSESDEYQNLFKYLVNTTGFTHSVSYQVQNIFRIRRHGEWERFEQKYGAYQNSCRRLLWHGSRTSNFGGILSQGLRIAPPEAPVSGYMFDKAAYLADASSKSANYCRIGTGTQPGLLLVCEAELGDPVLELVAADYEAAARAKSVGCIAAHGLGLMVPESWVDAEIVHPSLKGVLMPDPEKKSKMASDGGAGRHLMYNEYMAYDEAQVRLRYLIRFENVTAP